MKMKWVGWVLLIALFGVVAGCGAPKSFKPTLKPEFRTIELKDINYDKAWDVVKSMLYNEFSIEIIQKETGFIKTAWSNTWTGEKLPDYRVRLVVTFTGAHLDETVKIKAEAEYGRLGASETGIDTNLLEQFSEQVRAQLGQ